MVKGLPGSDAENPPVRALLVTCFPEVYESVARLLEPPLIELTWETSPRRAVETAREKCCPVMLVVAESDWRYVVRASGDSLTRPNVIVLLPEFDPGLWVMGFHAGAFDVLPFNADRNKLLATVNAAHERWRRRQLVSQARALNPLASIVIS